MKTYFLCDKAADIEVHCYMNLAQYFFQKNQGCFYRHSVESTTPTSFKIGFDWETPWGNTTRKWNIFCCYLKWLFFQEMMWNTVETMKRAQSPTPYIHAVIFSQRSSESRWRRALPTMAGTMRNWQNKRPLSGLCCGAAHRAAPAGRESLAPARERFFI